MTRIATIVGSPGTVSNASGGRTSAYNDISTTPRVIANQEAARQTLTVHNPGTVDIFVFPTYVQTTGSDVALSPTPSALGGCFLVYANGGTLVIQGECQKAYQAFSRSGSGNPLTVVGSHV